MFQPGVGQLLLSPAGGDLSTVIATQANLPVYRSAELAAGFYRQLAAGHASGQPMSPGAALARARELAYQGTHVSDAWSVPVCLARPAPLVLDAEERARDHRGRSNLPARRESFQPRPKVMEQILPALRRHRLVSFVGLPGIGKTELGMEAARILLVEQSGLQVLFQQVNRGFTPDRLRGLLAAAIGHERSPETDAELAVLLGEKPRFLVLDNAEDMMADAGAQSAFAAQLDAWLAGAPMLRVLLTTRWLVTGTRERERAIDIPPMTRDQTEALLLAELADSGVLDNHRRAAWTTDPAWQRLLDFLDGHPRSVWLVSHHFEGPRASLPRIVARLEQGRAEAVTDPSLIGRADLHAALPKPEERRLRSLVASIDFSFDVLETRHPEAAAAFLLLAHFPAGLPEPVAVAVVAAAEGTGNGQYGAGLAADRLDQLYRYHLLEWQGHRTFYPVPLRWYAEHKRNRRPDAPAPDLDAALAAYADYVETLNAGLVRDQEPTWVAAWLLEERTLLWIAGRPRPPTPRPAPEAGAAPSQLARLVTSATNLLGLAHRLDAWRKLGETGLADARTQGDVRGEANTLKALGDLFLRIAKLDEARNSYQDALPIYHQINDRLGEANCLQGVGRLALAEGDAAGAFRSFAELPVIYEAIQDRLGLQAALGYMARAAAALGQTDRALLLAGESLRIGRDIGDRFGQTINLELMLELFQVADDNDGLLAALVLIHALLTEIRDAARLDRINAIWQQVVEQLQPEELEQLQAGAHDLLEAALAAAGKRFGVSDPHRMD